MRKRLGHWFAWHPVRTDRGWRWLTYVVIGWVDLHTAEDVFTEDGYWTARALN
jgi:hypothetical protein